MPTACVNDDNPTSTPSHEVKVPDELLGIWNCDADNVDEVDLVTLDIEFKKDSRMEMAYNYYDYNSDSYKECMVKGTFRMLTHETFHEMKVGRMEVEHLGNIVFRHGDTEENKLNKELARKCIDEYLKYEKDPEALLSAPATRRANRATPGGRDQKNWMKNIPDDRMVCQLMIPGTHDSGTFALKMPWMLTIAKTQTCNWKEQFEAGIRAFDIRTRYHDNGNHIYHSMIECGVSLSEALDDIAELLQKNKDEGIILMIKGEAPDLSIGNNEDQRETMNWIGQIAAINYDGTLLDMETTTKETCKMVEKKLLDKDLLAEFKPNMTMRDLRGKALVILENQPEKWDINDARYGFVSGGIALHRGNTLVGSWSGAQADCLEQNEYECPKNSSIADFAKSKGKAFDSKLSESSKDPNKVLWSFNAANAYKFELKFIPDYVSCAEQVHPQLIESIKKHPGGRGIILQDFAGESTLRRVPAGRLLGFAGFSIIGSIPCKLIVGGLKTFVNKSLEFFGCKSRWTHDYITDTSIAASYGAALLVTGKTDTHGQELAVAALQLSKG